MIEETLAELIPFLFLPRAARAALADAATIRTYEAGELVIAQGDTSDRALFVLLSGSVEAEDTARDKVLGAIGSGRYFGERAALFETPRATSVRAIEPCTIASIPGDVFIDAVEQNASFAHALGSILRERQGLLSAFDLFLATLSNGVARDLVNFPELVRRYRDLEPALHPECDTAELDFEALNYALRRLPENITSAYTIYLTDAIHEHLDQPLEDFEVRKTPARRRATYEMTPGKIMVLLRDDLSDLIDFTTCLCAWAVEARKLRRRVQGAHALGALADAAAGRRPDDDALLAEVGFTDHEREHLLMLWPGCAGQRVYETALHHEDYYLKITKQHQGYNHQHAESWTNQIIEGTRALLGVTPGDLIDAERDVHIVSSNTHSVHNCLSPYLRAHRDRIVAWGQEAHPELAGTTWHDADDELYALARHWFQTHPEEVAVRERMDAEAGILRLERTDITGIVVELIDTARIDPALIDDGVLGGAAFGERPDLIVNIDYAFGQQAQGILAILLNLFGHSVRSVNILGKAGALLGARGDLLVADSFVEQTSDVLQLLPGSHSCDVGRLAARLPQRALHHGPILTVAGTLLQNRTMLHYYQHIWRCVGLEMEGTYYLRELRKSIDLGITPADVDKRFMYYVSDVPLSPGETLAGALHPAEGIPPLYAITREVLAGVLGD